MLYESIKVKYCPIWQCSSASESRPIRGCETVSAQSINQSKPVLLFITGAVRGPRIRRARGSATLLGALPHCGVGSSLSSNVGLQREEQKSNKYKAQAYNNSRTNSRTINSMTNSTRQVHAGLPTYRKSFSYFEIPISLFWNISLLDRRMQSTNQQWRRVQFTAYYARAFTAG